MLRSPPNLVLEARYCDQRIGCPPLVASRTFRYVGLILRFRTVMNPFYSAAATFRYALEDSKRHLFPMAAKSRFDALAHQARIGQFVSVGAVGAVIETIIVTILTAAFGAGPLLAKAAGAEVSISTMFAINDRWTFASEGTQGTSAIAKRWGKSHFVRVVGLAVSFTTLYLLTSHATVSATINGIDLWPTIANGIGIGIGMGINYVAETLFTWNVT